MPVNFLSLYGQKAHNRHMEQLLKTLEDIGINDQSIASIQLAGNLEEAREYILILIAMYDDRHEYI